MRVSVRPADSRRLFCLLAIAIVLVSGGALKPASAGPVTTTAQAGFNPIVIVDDGGSATANDSFSGSNGTGGSSTAFASPAGRLSVSATTTGIAPTGPHYSAGASFSVANDTTFNYQPDYLGGQDDWVQVGLTGALSGSIVGQGLGGTGSGRARVVISGNIWNAPQDEGGAFLGTVTADTGYRGGSVRSFNASQVININEFVSTGYFWVPRGDAITFNASLSVRVYSDPNPFGTEPSHHGTVTVDFADTFEFDPYAFFDILTPGVTANSPSLGLVNNQLVNFINTDPTAVPEPDTLALMSIGLAGFVVYRRRSKSTLGKPM